jgi:molybdopterin molybdotransferase
MDGIAIRSEDLVRGFRHFTLEATQAAGAPVVTLSSPGGAIEVMTGAMMPRGTDCVIPLEEYEVSAEGISLKGSAAGEPYRNVQRRGSDSQPGAPLLKGGTHIGAPEMGVLASAGLASVKVSRQPSFRVISTGDELIEPGLPILEHQIRRSNSYAVVGALLQHGFTQVADDHIADSEEMMYGRLGRHLAENDVLVLSGGVSKGKFDLVPKVLKSLKVEEVFYQVAQRPGRPMWFGIGPQGQAVFGLPGNPVSTLICLIRYVVPAMDVAMGAHPATPEQIALAAPVKRGRPTASFVPVSIQHEAGRRSALPRMPNGSGDFLALAHTDGFVELPPQAEPYPPGFVADLYRW